MPVKHHVEKAELRSLMLPRNTNKIFSCLVVFPPARAIYKFNSGLEFLEAYRDCIETHKSLHQDRKILHCDIPENNVISTDAENKNEPKAKLINLDLAMELGSDSSEAKHWSGTKELMAIENLEEETTHTYRHDLESCVYVFLRVVIRYGQKENH